MVKQFSKVDPTKLLYSVVRFKDIGEQRLDASPSTEYLQLNARKLEKDTVVKAHRHLPIKRTTDITQEAWIVLEGIVEGTFYDLDDTVIETVELYKGDSVILFRGGHKLAIKETAILYELKTGPYYGEKNDKQFIEQ